MREEDARKAKSQTVGNLYDLYCLEYLLRIFSFFFFFFGGGGGGECGIDASILVLHYSRSYASVHDIKENAHMISGFIGSLWIMYRHTV